MLCVHRFAPLRRLRRDADVGPAAEEPAEFLGQAFGQRELSLRQAAPTVNNGQEDARSPNHGEHSVPDTEGEGANRTNSQLGHILVVAADHAGNDGA